ncbi:hypothetical protein [Stigmatella aurantiaca]|uniref:Lipoprotein n=1 Tax=Stigmatella aurantiaca (strain DW4/3-1) TaxID=378806 RepID=Q094F1_STIAD|nr:hypothetical protein [Stigmatella aurantiaca]ADO68157.1 Putative lipoprotein [Stigmatella aurantiaca DW4/3-1]EAU67108.1 hypothetical protein STIAU_2651 [Stigmatella aurantiaca DW4/3-1]
MMARGLSWKRCIRGVGISVALTLMGCGPVMDSARDEAGGEQGTWEDPIRIPNSLLTRALVFNAMTTNRQAIGWLKENSLTALFTPPGIPYLQTQLLDSNAQWVMSYLVGCALSAGQPLVWKNPLTNTNQVWTGEAGLCPEWATSVPSDACLERVSACLLARNNPFGRRVDLSMRGQNPSNPNTFGLDLQTRPSGYYPGVSTPVASLAACTSTQSGASRNCGWTRDYMGACTPGSPVRVGAGGFLSPSCSGAPLGSTTSGQMLLRVCGDIATCDDTAKLNLTSTCSASLPPAGTFTCPASGYFNVMTAPSNSSGQASGTVAVAAPHAYRLSEAEVFPVREGAYYGTVFDAKALAIEIRVDGYQPVAVDVATNRVLGPASSASVSGSVYRKMYSCYDANWTSGYAAATYRVCADPANLEDCAAQVEGACLEPTLPSFPNSKCATGDGPMVVGDGDYEGCRSNDNYLWTNPVTVFLHAPCDVLAGYKNPTLCQRR